MPPQRKSHGSPALCVPGQTGKCTADVATEVTATGQTTQSSRVLETGTLNCCAQLWHGDAQHSVTKNPLVASIAYRKMDAKPTTELRAFGKPGRQK